MSYKHHTSLLHGQIPTVNDAHTSNDMHILDEVQTPMALIVL